MPSVTKRQLYPLVENKAPFYVEARQLAKLIQQVNKFPLIQVSTFAFKS